MEYDQDKVDDMTLALLYLVASDRKDLGIRASKGFDWDTMNRLHEKGYIANPKSKAMSVAVTEEGYRRSKQLFQEYFGTREK